MLITQEEKDGKVFVTIPEEILTKIYIVVGEDEYPLNALINSFYFTGLR